MSILQPIHEIRSSRFRPLPSRSNDTVLRATGVLSLLAIGAIHFLQIVPTTEATPLLGMAFMVLIVASLLLAARLATSGDALTWMATALLTAGAIGGYVFTRTFNTPLDNLDAGNWSCMLGLAALFVETTLLASSVYTAMPAHVLQPAMVPTSERPARRRTDRSNAA